MSFLTVSILAIFLAGGALAFFKGGPPERITAAILVAWIYIDAVYHLLFGPSSFDTVDPVHFVFDGVQLAAIGWVALHANRMWPLWAAAASLVCFAGHFAILIQPGGMRRAYWALSSLPQYIQLAALLLGTWWHGRRLKKLGGPYRSWRKPAEDQRLDRPYTGWSRA